MAQWDRDNVVGFWADPIFGSGDFPESMKTFFGEQMPVLSDANQSLLKGSADFYGANTYGGKVTKSAAFNTTLSDYGVGDDPDNNLAERYSCAPCDNDANPCPQSMMVHDDFECGAASLWLWAKPDSMYQYLNYITTTYHNPKIYVTEFGGDIKGEGDKTAAQAQADDWRVKYYKLYMMQVARAQTAGSNIKGVFAWSLMDNFEWGDGLNFRFGITYVDFTTGGNLARTPKDSANWWTQLIASMNTSESAIVA